MFKKIICFLMLLIPWFVSSILFPFDAGFYNSLNLPKITPPKFVFVIIWPILFTLITITLYRILKKDSLNNDYLYILIMNFIGVETYNLFFFYMNNLFLSLVSTVVTLVTSIFLTIETRKLDNSWGLLIPYNIWCLYAFILITSIYLTN